MSCLQKYFPSVLITGERGRRPKDKGSKMWRKGMKKDTWRKRKPRGIDKIGGGCIGQPVKTETSMVDGDKIKTCVAGNVNKF